MQVPHPIRLPRAPKRYFLKRREARQRSVALAVSARPSAVYERGGLSLPAELASPSGSGGASAAGTGTDSDPATPPRLSCGAAQCVGARLSGAASFAEEGGTMTQEWPADEQGEGQMGNVGLGQHEALP